MQASDVYKHTLPIGGRERGQYTPSIALKGVVWEGGYMYMGGVGSFRKHKTPMRTTVDHNRKQRAEKGKKEARRNLKRSGEGEEKK